MKCTVSSLVKKNRLLVIFHGPTFYQLFSQIFELLKADEQWKEGWRDAFFYCQWAHVCMFHIWRLQSSEMKQSTFSLSLSTSFSYHATRDRSTFMKKGFYFFYFFFSALLTLNMIQTQLKWLMGYNPHSFRGCMTLVLWGSLLYTVHVYLWESFNCIVL